MRDTTFPRVQALPDHPDRASLQIDGLERIGYVFNPGGTRPFFYPVVGPSGRPLTRIGHPNPVGHEHHKSVWFGHESVAGISFWGDRPGTDVQIRHRRITLYHDGDDFAGFVAELEWWAQGRAWLRHRLIAALEPLSDGACALDLQSRFEPAAEAVPLGRTNFGFLGVRMAKTVSAQFGGGLLSNTEGATGEPAIFGLSSRWVDYSGPVAPGVIEGIAYLDHPDNPHHPTPWHVRSDGWMEAAFNLAEPYLLAPDHPLDLRYRLWIHPGPADRAAIDRAWDAFARLRPYEIAPAQGQALAALVRPSR